MIERNFKQGKGFLEPKDEEFSITWRDVSIYTKTRSRNFFGRNPQPYKRIINNVTGAVKAGNLVVLMGPSGAGKSTLMEALAHQNATDIYVEGDIRVNGVPINKDMHQISGFVHQEDLFVETLTVQEHLEFMAALKLSQSKTKKEIRHILDKFIIETGLSSCLDTKIGKAGEEKCLSGGERKRLSFASQILTDPPILFCDEPTTGLDSFSAQSIVHLMKEMSGRGKTVLCTIHQPSSELFSMFQQLILISEGRIVYIGDSESALEFFQEHGYPCPPNYNPAEVIMKALSTTSKYENRVRIKKLCDEFSVSKTAAAIEEYIMSTTQDQQEIQFYTTPSSKDSRNASLCLTKIYWLTRRSFLQALRDPSVQTVRILQKLGIALMASLCFYGTVHLDQAGVQSLQGAIFVLVTENTFPPMYGVLPLFPDEFPLFLRENKNNLYSVHLYYISKVIALLPGLVIEPILFVLVAYFIMGLKKTAYAFFMTNLIAILTANVAAACGCFFSNAFGSVSMALAFLVPIDYALMVTSGLFIKLTSIPFVVGWFRYFSWLLFSNEALSIVQWENVKNITCEFNSADIPCLVTGKDVLRKFDFLESHLFEDIMAMVSLYIIFHVLACIFLNWRINRRL